MFDLDKIDRESFNVFEKVIGDDTIYLVYARSSPGWNVNNLIYRSSVWTKEGQLISASFRKFFNWDEHPDLDPKPYSISECQLIEKIDGSALIVSKYKGNLIVRTRGSIDVSGCENASEIDLFKTTYPKVFNNIGESYSCVYEWVSPTNRIILQHEKPDIYLIAVINHDDYSMWTQDKLDDLAMELQVKRPRVFKFSTIEEMIETVKEFKGIEGICVYYSHGQKIRKTKSSEYLLRHRFKYELSLENVLDMYLKFEEPKYNEFMNRVGKEFDWECLQFIQGLASKICDASVEVRKIMDHMNKFADSVRQLPRKEAAEKVLSAYGKTSRSGFVFHFLDNREIKVEGLKKLYLQVLEKT
jgi:hypothetical protein